MSVGRRRGRVIQSARNCRPSQRLLSHVTAPLRSNACAVWCGVIIAEIVSAISSMIATPGTDASHAPASPLAVATARSTDPRVQSGVTKPAIPRPIA